MCKTTRKKVPSYKREKGKSCLQSQRPVRKFRLTSWKIHHHGATLAEEIWWWEKKPHFFPIFIHNSIFILCRGPWNNWDCALLEKCTGKKSTTDREHNWADPLSHSVAVALPSPQLIELEHAIVPFFHPTQRKDHNFFLHQIFYPSLDIHTQRKYSRDVRSA